MKYSQNIATALTKVLQATKGTNNLSQKNQSEILKRHKPQELNVNHSGE